MRIVFCGGGTAGHITPNIALIDKLQNEECFYIGTNGMEKSLTESMVRSGKIRDFFEIDAAKFRRKLSLKNLAIPFRLAQSVRQSKKILKKISPDVVFSKGGYVGLPVVIAAKLCKIPSVIHESDMTMGLANKISALLANETLCAYPTCPKAKSVGCIVRKEILRGNRQKGLETMNFDGAKPILLVMGGSLGAKSLNEAVDKNAAGLTKIFDVFVICGKGKKIDNKSVKQAEFVSNIADIFAASSVCLTRAGSNALCELTLTNVPFLAIPLEKCSRGEQQKNAKFFEENGCCMILRENDLNDKLIASLTKLFENKSEFIAKQQAMRYLYGTDNVIQHILKYKQKDIYDKNSILQNN